MMSECGTDNQDCDPVEGEEYSDYVYNVLHNEEERRENTEKVEIAGQILGTIGSVAVEPVDWALTAGECLGGDCSPLALLGLLPLIPSSSIDDFVEIGTITIRKIGGETVDTIAGRVAHNNYPLALGSGYEYNRALPSGLRPDAVDWENNIVRELKPDNAAAIQKGWSQVRKYLNELVEITGETWTAFVDTYAK